MGGLVGFVLVFQALVAAGQQGGETFFDNLFLTVPAVLAWGCGTAAFFTGAWGIMKSRERSVCVFLTTIIGLLVIVFIAGEVLAPH